MVARGTVSSWRGDEGWGVITSDETPGGCWAHFSTVLVEGFAALVAGQEVRFTFESVPDQDGYRYRTLEVWPADREPARRPDRVDGPMSAYSSTLTLTFDDPDDDAP